MGSEPTYALAVDDRTPTTSTTLTALVAELIAGYDTTGDDDLEQRYRFAVLAASQVQAVLAADAVADGTFDPADHDEATLTALFASRAHPVPEQVETWGLAVPLVLVATDYEPYTDRALPLGNVKVVDPADERTLLGSLSDLGVVSLYVQDGKQ